MKTRAELVIFGLCLTILVLTFTRIYIQIKYSTLGNDLQIINSKVSQLDHENMLLEQQVLNQESYTLISKEASQSGFIETNGYYRL